jgi:hypothetical protein
MAADRFDPYRLLEALDRRRVGYVIVGALGRVIHGSGEVTEGLDVVPSPREDNLGRLALALEDLHAHGPDGQRPLLERDLADGALLVLKTDAGELKLVPEPAGTRGYDDLRRAASREPLGQGLRPQVASLDDHARMLVALGRDGDRERILTLHRLIELERSLGRGIEL